MTSEPMRKQSIEHPTTRPVFISHAASDRDIVNFFIDTILIRGIGINHEAIFNTSATASPIPPGSNFTEDIRQNLRGAETIITLVTQAYYERPFAMAELGAAWAFGNLIPILVPPLDFENATGVLKGTQCFKLNNKGSLSALYDLFTKTSQPKANWLTPTGHGTFEEQRDSFLKALPKKLKGSAVPPTSPTTKTANKPTPPASQPETSLEDAKQIFLKLISDLRATLAKLPPLVRVAFLYEIRGKKLMEPPEREGEIDDAVNRGQLRTENAWPMHTSDYTSARIIWPTKSTQRNRDVYQLLGELAAFLKSAPPTFHHYYEEHADHPASLQFIPFWKKHRLLHQDDTSE
ncbi:toll/interleukin-1 receptor domain-containing protein [Myxococcus sp. MISCRS1]|uniref:toll/interleukin-1 receptor domain-containing protein n=1 Tax=Myxococcus sp. MISCRS1 TaxID=2996786 RepID=UPI00226F0557|nr:toll/interleukin-1 receptor domain-containing protein [Myxococcus sp. MISCRS1]MCY0997924.1 toll/interleukin-1 receptor domain-containing protein [Myxococcus sp. MISCRS1]